MNQYQEYIHKSRYAKFLPEMGRRENWDETVQRYVDYVFSKNEKLAVNVELKNEILNDPQQLGYSNFLPQRNDVELAGLLNQVRSGDEFKVQKGRVSRDSFVEDTASVVYELMVALDNGNSRAQFWLNVFDRLVSNSDTINSADANLNYILEQMISDNLLTSNQKDDIVLRQGSRAEVLFDRAVLVSDVSDALNEVN